MNCYLNILNIELFYDFLEMRGYVQKLYENDKVKWVATGMGVEFGYAMNLNGSCYITKKAFERAFNAFALDDVDIEYRKKIGDKINVDELKAVMNEVK